VNYDMTFNTIVLDSVIGGAPYFAGTPKSPFCVLGHPRTDSEMFGKMAGYTVLLTKWEIYDDKVDKPSVKTNLIDLTFTRAVSKAEEMYPEYDRMVGDGFSRLRELEKEGCTDAVRMGREFGRYLSRPLNDISGGVSKDELGELFTSLTAAVYVMDAVDDLESDFRDGTYNPFLESCKMFVNRGEYMRENVYGVTETLNGAVGDLQRAYVGIRSRMGSLAGVSDNIVYFGIPESARNAVAGKGTAKMSVKNAMDGRRSRTATY